MDGLDNAIREIAELVEENKRLREALWDIKESCMECENNCEEHCWVKTEIAKEVLEG